MEWYVGRARARFLAVAATFTWMLWVGFMMYVLYIWGPRMFMEEYYFSAIILLWMAITCAVFLGLKLMRLWTIMVYGPEFYVTHVYPQEVAEFLRDHRQ